MLSAHLIAIMNLLQFSLPAKYRTACRSEVIASLSHPKQLVFVVCRKSESAKRTQMRLFSFLADILPVARRASCAKRQ